MAGLEKALAFASDLFNAMESAGHRVAISAAADHFVRERIEEHEKLPERQRRDAWYGYGRLWSPQRPTVAYVGSVAFGLAIIEM